MIGRGLGMLILLRMMRAGLRVEMRRVRVLGC